MIMKGDPRVTVMHKTEKASNLNKLGEGDSRERLFESCIIKILAAKQTIFF